MRIRSSLWVGLWAAAMLPLVAGCGEDDIQGNTPGTPVVGTWIARNIETPDGDAIADGGMAMVATISDAGTIAFNITGDQLGYCDPGPDCTITGTWTHTDNTVTIDSGTGNATVNYSIDGDIMTWTGTIGGVATEIVFNRLL
jgi:hypothetical protein